IYADVVSTHKNAAEYSLFKPMDENFRVFATEGVESFYNTFISKVAQGRGMTKEQVHEVAQGRVWTGVDAKRLGLVDEIGGLEAAVQYAAKLSEVEKFSTVNFPVFEKTSEEFFKELNPFMVAKTQEALLK